MLKVTNIITIFAAENQEKRKGTKVPFFIKKWTLSTKYLNY